MRTIKSFEQYTNTTDNFMNNPTNYKFNSLKDLKDDMKLKLKQFVDSGFDSLSQTQREELSKLIGIPKEQLVNVLPTIAKEIRMMYKKSY